MDEQTRRRFERWQLESLAGGETAKAGLFGKTLGLLGLDADGNRAATSWTDAAKHTAGNLINAPQDIGNQLLDLQDYQPVYGTGASNPEDRARAGQQAVSTFGLAGLAPIAGAAAGRMTGRTRSVEQPTATTPEIANAQQRLEVMQHADAAVRNRIETQADILNRLHRKEMSLIGENTELRAISPEAFSGITPEGNLGNAAKFLMPEPGQDPVPGVRRLDSSALYANSKEGALPGLAMDHASRMQRARELGYDPDTTLYHGTNKEFDSFDTGKAGSGVGTSGESATWLTPSPAEASAWAKVTGGGNGDRVLPVHTRMTNPKIISSSELTQLRIPSKPDTLAYNSKVFEAELEKARAAGHDGVVFKNVDEGFAHGAQDQIAVFDPSNIRSKFAAFDPTQSHSPDLLASNAREGAVPGLGMTAQSEQNDPYRTALQMQARRKLLGLPY